MAVSTAAFPSSGGNGLGGGRRTHVSTRGHQTVTQFSPRRRVSLNAHLFKLSPANRRFFDWLQSCTLNLASLPSHITRRRRHCFPTLALRSVWPLPCPWLLS